MQWTKLATFFLLSPFGLATFLSYKNFSIDTNATLSLFVSLVWGVLVALGGGFFFISNLDFKKQKRKKQFMESVSKRIQGVSLAILLHTAIFVFLSFLYPIRSQIVQVVGWDFVTNYNLRSLYDSLLYVEIIFPSVASVLIGIWCVMLVINQE